MRCFLLLRPPLLDLFQTESRNNGDVFIRKFGIGKHGVNHFELGLCSAFFLAFMKVIFVCHILVPYESVGFVMRHLAVDGFGLVRVYVPGRKVLHVRPDDRIGELPVLCKYIKVFAAIPWYRPFDAYGVSGCTRS